MPHLPFLLPLLVACGGPDVVGTWAGDCAISAMGYETVYDFELEITDDEKKQITGVGLIDDGYFPYDVDVVGERKGKNLDLDLEIVLPGDTDDDFGLNFGIEAKVKGDTMEGDCIVGAMGFGVRGDLVMDRL